VASEHMVSGVEH